MGDYTSVSEFYSCCLQCLDMCSWLSAAFSTRCSMLWRVQRPGKEINKFSSVCGKQVAMQTDSNIRSGPREMLQGRFLGLFFYLYSLRFSTALDGNVPLSWVKRCTACLGNLGRLSLGQVQPCLAWEQNSLWWAELSCFTTAGAFQGGAREENLSHPFS